MYNTLFSTMKIGNVELKNRLAVTAMVTNYCNQDGTLTERYMRYHEEKAKGGWGLIITEDYAINENGKGYDRIPGLYNDEQILLNKEFTQRIQKYGTKIICQIYHPGRQTNHYVNGGVQPIAPSPIPCPYLKDIPKEITKEEINLIVSQFGDAALRAKKSGFDGAEIHLAHGYLLFEFLSPHTNKRTDEYGGCFKNRFRIVKEVYEDVRKKVGYDFLVTCRLSSRDGFFGGRDIFDSMELAVNLESLGFQCINVSSGSYGSHSNYDIDSYKHGYVAPYAELIKQVVNIPIMCTNRITTAGVAEVILRSRKADLIGMGRTSLADPHFPNKVKAGNEESIRHCINCNLGCYGNLLTGKMCSCLVNPTVGREGEIDNIKTENKKTVYIAGGGPGGVQAAILGVERGYKVVIFEATERLGGQLLSAAYPPGKGELTLFTSWLEKQVKEKEIEVRYKTSLTREIVEKEKPDAVIVATGGTPFVPPIKGINLPHVHTAEEVLLGEVATGDNVVVCGGGEVGVETATAIAFRENGQVSIVEMLPNIFSDLQYKRLLGEYEAKIFTNTKVLEITEDSVIVDTNGTEKVIPAETVVLAFGYKPNNKLADDIKDLCEVKVIGGSVKTGNALEATGNALDAILEI